LDLIIRFFLPSHLTTDYTIVTSKHEQAAKEGQWPQDSKLESKTANQ